MVKQKSFFWNSSFAFGMSFVYCDSRGADYDLPLGMGLQKAFQIWLFLLAFGNHGCIFIYSAFDNLARNKLFGI